MANESARIIIIDAETGESYERDLTPEELAETKASADAYQAEVNAKLEAKASVLAKLEALGLTAEEIAAL